MRTLLSRLVRMVRDPMTTLVLLVASTMICISEAATMPLRYGDLVWQRWVGETILRSHRIPMSLGNETFTAAGSPWIDHEWLFAVGTTMLKNSLLAGAFEVTIGAAIAGAIGLGVYRTWIRSRSNAAACVVVLLTIGLVIPFESVRAQQLGWFFLSLSLAIIESENARLKRVLPLIGILWANVHASVILLPTLLAMRAFFYALDDRRISSKAGSSLVLALLTLACSWINPAGVRLTGFAIGLQSSVELPLRVIEWRQPSLANPIVALIAVPLIVYGVAGTAARRKWWDFFLVVFFAALFAHAQRHLALFAIAAAPAAVVSFRSNDFLENGAGFSRLWIRRYAATLTAAFTSAAAFYVFFAPASFRADSNLAYLPAVDAALALPGTHRVFCEDFMWCTLFLGQPRFRIWWDARVDAYPASVARQALEIDADRPHGASQRNLARYGVDIVIARRDAALNDALAVSHWHLLTEKQNYLVWRTPAHNVK